MNLILVVKSVMYSKKFMVSLSYLHSQNLSFESLEMYAEMMAHSMVESIMYKKSKYLVRYKKLIFYLKLYLHE